MHRKSHAAAAMFLTVIATPTPSSAAQMTVYPDGRVCYNSACLGYYDTPLVQCEPRQHAPVPALKGRDYAAVRAALVLLGWKPILNTEPMLGGGKREADDGRLEVESCAGSAAVCRFGFRDRDGNYLRVLEHADRVTAFFPCDD